MEHNVCPGARGVAAITIVMGLAGGATAMAQAASVEAGGPLATDPSSHGVEPRPLSREGPTCPLVAIRFWNDREGLVVKHVPHCRDIEQTATITKD